MELTRLNLNDVLEQVGKEKNIDRAVLIEALEAAMLSAASKKLGLQYIGAINHFLPFLPSINA